MRDTTFVIPVRLDSIPRLENILIIINRLCRYFNTTIVVVEIANHYNGILASLLPRKVAYIFREDKDNVLYRTKHLNQVIPTIHTDMIALWDVDVVIDKKAVIEAVSSIRLGNADVAFPYNGMCFDTSEVLRNYYLKRPDVRILHRNINKLHCMYDPQLVGGGVIIKREKYIQAGMESEIHYGWGNDDFDRFYRFMALGYKIYRVNTPLFHLWHPRGNNSHYRSDIFRIISNEEVSRVRNSSKEEIEYQIRIAYNNTD